MGSRDQALDNAVQALRFAHRESKTATKKRAITAAIESVRKAKSSR
jgi:hypothetical protein